MAKSHVFVFFEQKMVFLIQTDLPGWQMASAMSHAIHKIVSKNAANLISYRGVRRITA